MPDARTDDLMTIIDFCDAMARCEPNAVALAHELAHRLSDETDRYVNFRRLKKYADSPDWLSSLHGPAWPDVRRRMLDLLERTQG